MTTYSPLTINIISFTTSQILTIVEFIKVLFSGEDKTMKDAFKATTTRFILLAIVVFLPILVEFIIKLSGMSEDCLQYFVK